MKCLEKITYVVFTYIKLAGKVILNNQRNDTEQLKNVEVQECSPERFSKIKGCSSKVMVFMWGTQPRMKCLCLAWPASHMYQLKGRGKAPASWKQHKTHPNQTNKTMLVCRWGLQGNLGTFLTLGLKGSLHRTVISWIYLRISFLMLFSRFWRDWSDERGLCAFHSWENNSGVNLFPSK